MNPTRRAIFGNARRESDSGILASEEYLNLLAQLEAQITAERMNAWFRRSVAANPLEEQFPAA
jgi:hypothetical protein